VESVALSHGPDHDLPIVSINKPKAAPAADDAAPAAAEDGEASEE
jgi:large subunit ribosomal protein L25